MASRAWGQQGCTLCSWHENPLWMFHPSALGAHRDKEPPPYGGVWGQESIVFIIASPSHTCLTACDSIFLRSESWRLSSSHSSCFTFLKIANEQRLPPPFLPALERLPQLVPSAALAAFPCHLFTGVIAPRLFHGFLPGSLLKKLSQI